LSGISRIAVTAIQTDARLQRCLVYIDLNMVRAGVAKHRVAVRSAVKMKTKPPLIA